MNHFQPFCPRKVVSLPVVKIDGWHIKQYALLAEGKKYDQEVVSAALDGAVERLPQAGSLDDQYANHGTSFQIIHFAEVAVVSPVFYWQWGSVLASIHQMRAPWEHPTKFETGVKEVVGCIWEMEIINFEVAAWTNTMLGNVGTPQPHEKLAKYFECRLPSAKSLAET